MRIVLPILLLGICLISTPAVSWNHSEIEWKTIKTEHFEIHFHPGAEWSAEQTALIAEEVYGPITRFYGYEPNTVHISIFDFEDDPAGATYYYHNRIDISASSFYFYLRGTANWLRNVITHEFTHMVSVQQSMKFPLRMPAFHFQVISFEKEKRPDVITGYPNTFVSIPFTGEIMPHWFAEGLAQYQCGLARNDIWDSHRDMLLRSAALDGRLLTIDEMGVFDKNSLESEMVYNQGFALVRYISEEYGREKLSELTNALRSVHRITFGGACKKVLGMSDSELYNAWRTDIEENYREIASRIDADRRAGERSSEEGFMNICPVGDGRGGYFYLSNRGSDRLYINLVHRDSSGSVKEIDHDVESSFDLSRDKGFLCYAKRTDKNDNGYEIDDIFIYDIAKTRARRLTKSIRASDPCWSPDGSAIACVVKRGGSERIAIVDAESGATKNATPLVKGRQYYSLSWGSRGILASRFDGVSRDIVLIGPNGEGYEEVIATLADERDPEWDETGEGFFYASDRSGIFNIYHRHLDSGKDLRVTNVLGGAFFPAVEGAGLLYAGFNGGGYHIRRLKEWSEGAVSSASIYDDLGLQSMRESCIKVQEGQDLREEPKIDMSKAENFGIDYSRILIFPNFLIYDNKPRIGLYLDTRDFLDRQALMAGGSVNLDGEFDVQLGFETRQFKPTFTFDVYRSRVYYSYFTRFSGSDLELYYRYDLWDAYFKCKIEMARETRYHKNEVAFQYNHGEYGLNFELWEFVPEREFRYAVGWNYYKANEYSLLYSYRNIERKTNSDINPRRGRRLELELTYADDKLSSGEFEFAFMPIYDENRHGRYQLSYEEHVPLPFWSHALSLYVRAGIIDNSLIDDFFYLYLGGWDGLKGYSYYSMGGRKLGMGRVLYRFPILERIDKQFLSIYFSALYAGVFFEAGKAWNEDELDLKGNKKDWGFEVRLKGFSFYSIPLAASFEAAYGLNDVEYNSPFNDEITFYEGKTWRYYTSVLFSF
jgi:hypothetical protein